MYSKVTKYMLNLNKLDHRYFFKNKIILMHILTKFI